MIPSAYASVLLAVAAWRTFHLLAFDDILNGVRQWLTKVPLGWEEGDPRPKDARYGLIEFIHCPYCLGAWVAGAWWLMWYAFPHGTLVTAVPFALSAGVVAAQRYLSAN